MWGEEWQGLLFRVTQISGPELLESVRLELSRANKSDTTWTNRSSNSSWLSEQGSWADCCQTMLFSPGFSGNGAINTLGNPETCNRSLCTELAGRCLSKSQSNPWRLYACLDHLNYGEAEADLLVRVLPHRYGQIVLNVSLFDDTSALANSSAPTRMSMSRLATIIVLPVNDPPDFQVRVPELVVNEHSSCITRSPPPKLLPLSYLSRPAGL